MEKSNPQYYQFSTLLKIAESIQEKMTSYIGHPIPGERNEKFLLYISYDQKYCKKVSIHGTSQNYWDIPQYSNGTIRHAKCLFLVPSHDVEDAAYPYLIKDNSEMEQKYSDDPGYDREKVLMKEFFGKDKIEIVWSFDYKKPEKYGNYFYVIDNFWFGIRKNGVLISKEDSINKLLETTDLNSQSC